MAGADRLRRLREALASELRQLLRINASDRPWEMPLVAALCSGLPIFIGAAYGELGHGLVASLGGLVFLYLPSTPLSHRMAWLMACAFGLVACYTLGILSHLYLPLRVPMLAVITVVVTMVCRFYAVAPPGSLFFVLAAAIGAYTPAPGLEAVLRVGLIAMGSVLAVGLAFAYSLHRLGREPAAPVRAPQVDFDYVILDAFVIGAFVAVSLALAQLLQLPRPYWVPVSCLAVIQGASLRAVWTRQVHRIAGTALGLGVFWAVVALPLDDWGVAVAITLLALVVETLVVRHYGLAVVFITPLTILLADAAHLAGSDPQALMQARLLDTVVGATVGLAGGACLHSPRFRAAVGPVLRRWLLPRR